MCLSLESKQYLGGTLFQTFANFNLFMSIDLISFVLPKPFYLDSSIS